MLRSCYETKMRFTPGGPLVSVYYYRVADDAKLFPYPNAFVSRNWDTDYDWGDVGEVRPDARPWRNGQRPSLAQGKGGPCEPADYWAIGQPSATIPDHPQAGGVPLCCLPEQCFQPIPNESYITRRLPQGDFWAWVTGCQGGVGSGTAYYQKLQLAKVGGGGVGNGSAAVVRISVIGARVNDPGPQNVAAGPGNLVLNFANIDFDFGNLYQGGGIMQVPVHGIYLIAWQQNWFVNVGVPTPSNQSVTMRVNAANVAETETKHAGTNPDIPQAFTGATTYELQANDQVDLLATNNEIVTTYSVGVSDFTVILLQQLP